MNRIDLTVLKSEPATEYHAKANDYLSSHQLIDFMSCPYLYHKKRSGLIEDRDSPAYLIGRAAHTRILEGVEVYEKEYAIGGPINPSTGKPYGNTTKKFIEWQEVQQKPVLPFDKSELIASMNTGVRMNDYACELLEVGKAEGVVRAEYCGVPCQIRIDWLNPDLGIVDLKTCDDLTWFEADARRFRYQYQLAFYRSVLSKVIGDLVPVYIIAVEKKEPFRCGVWRIDEQSLDFARATNESGIARLKTAKADDKWPTGYEELRFMTFVA